MEARAGGLNQSINQSIDQKFAENNFSFETLADD
jgi:hypothetical protein